MEKKQIQLFHSKENNQQSYMKIEGKMNLVNGGQPLERMQRSWRI